MKNLIFDLCSAGRFFRQMRKAHAKGAGLEAREVKTLTVVNMSHWAGTMESCLLSDKDIYDTVRDVFYNLPEEIQESLTHTPKERGGWLARAQFWKKQLSTALEPDLYYPAMLEILRHYVHCTKKALSPTPTKAKGKSL